MALPLSKFGDELQGLFEALTKDADKPPQSASAHSRCSLAPQWHAWSYEQCGSDSLPSDEHVCPAPQAPTAPLYSASVKWMLECHGNRLKTSGRGSQGFAMWRCIISTQALWLTAGSEVLAAYSPHEIWVANPWRKHAVQWFCADRSDLIFQGGWSPRH